MQLMRALTDYENTTSLVNRMRSERLRFFEERIAALGLERVRILDVGGYEKFWRMRGYHSRPEIDITILNLNR